MNGVTTVTIALGLAAVTLAPGPVRAGEPSAAEIVERNVAARGGLEAWRKVESMVWSGRIQSARAPDAAMQFRLEQKRPNRTRLQLTARSERSMRVFDGVRGWKLRAAGGPAQILPYTPQELKYARTGDGLDGPLIDYAAKGHTVTLEGTDVIGGRKAYHLDVRLAKGGNVHVWIDAETWLDVRHDRTADGPVSGQRRVSVLYGDYRTVEGLKMPFLITTGGGQDMTPDKMQIESVVLNAPLDDAAFEPPVTRRRPAKRARSTTEARLPSRAAPRGAPSAASPAGPPPTP